VNEKAIFSAIGEILNKELVKRDERIEALAKAQAEITVNAVIEQVFTEGVVERLRNLLVRDAEIDYAQIVAAIKTDPDMVEALRGEKGETSELDVDEVVKKLVPYIPEPIQPKAGVDGIGIKSVEQGDTGSFDLVLDNDQTIQVKLPQPLKGEQGDKGLQGSDGRNGLDRPDISIRKAGPGLERNDFTRHNGGLYVATKNTIGTPEDDAGAYELVLNGIDQSHVAFNESERKMVFTVRLTDGELHQHSVDSPAGYLADPESVSSLFKGDYTIEGTKLKTWDGEVWQEQQLRGSIGREGKAGAGISDVKISGKSLQTKTTTGQTFATPFIDIVAEQVAVDLVPTIAELVRPEDNTEGEIKCFVGQWKHGNANRAGDVVTTGNGMYLALVDTKEAPEASDDWRLMMPTQTVTTVITDN